LEEEGRLTVVDYLVAAGVSERDARKLAAVIRRSRRITVSDVVRDMELSITMRGVLEGEEGPPIKGVELDGAIVKAGRGYVAVFWREGERRWGYVIVAGACDAHRSVRP